MVVLLNGFSDRQRKFVLALFRAHKLLFLLMGEKSRFDKNGGHSGPVEHQETSLFDPPAMASGMVYEFLFDESGQFQALRSIGALEQFKNNVGSWVVGIETVVSLQVIAFHQNR